MFNKLKKRFNKPIQYMKELLSILGRKEVGLLPNYIAFLIIVSFIPILTLIFEVIYIIIQNNNQILDALKTILPTNVYTMIVLLIKHNGGHISILTISNVLLLYLTSQVYLAFYQSYVVIFNFKKRQHFLKDRIMALINTLLLVVLIFFLTGLTVFNHYIYHFIHDFYINFPYVYYLYNYINFALSITIISIIVTFLMVSIPDIKQTVKDVFRGALFVTLSWIIVSYGFKIYVERFANYETIYSSFATIIIFVTWIYLISYVLILGIAINKVSQKFTTHENSKS